MQRYRLWLTVWLTPARSGGSAAVCSVQVVRFEAETSIAAGFKTAAFPYANAGATFQIGIAAGKFHGVMDHRRQYAVADRHAGGICLTDDATGRQRCSSPLRVVGSAPLVVGEHVVVTVARVRVDGGLLNEVYSSLYRRR